MKTFKKEQWEELKEILEYLDNDEELVIIKKSDYDELLACQERIMEILEQEEFVFGDNMPVQANED